VTSSKGEYRSLNIRVIDATPPLRRDYHAFRTIDPPLLCYVANLRLPRMRAATRDNSSRSKPRPFGKTLSASPHCTQPGRQRAPVAGGQNVAHQNVAFEFN
jgi:hypothetical protein